MNNVCRQADTWGPFSFFCRLPAGKTLCLAGIRLGIPMVWDPFPYLRPATYEWAWQRPKATFSAHLLRKRQSFLMFAHILVPTQDYLRPATGRMRVIK